MVIIRQPVTDIFAYSLVRPFVSLWALAAMFARSEPVILIVRVRGTVSVIEIRPLPIAPVISGVAGLIRMRAVAITLAAAHVTLITGE